MVENVGKFRSSCYCDFSKFKLSALLRCPYIYPNLIVCLSESYYCCSSVTPRGPPASSIVKASYIVNVRCVCPLA